MPSVVDSGAPVSVNVGPAFVPASPHGGVLEVGVARARFSSESRVTAGVERRAAWAIVHRMILMSCLPMYSVYAGGMAWESSSRVIQSMPIALTQDALLR